MQRNDKEKHGDAAEDHRQEVVAEDQEHVQFAFIEAEEEERRGV